MAAVIVLSIIFLAFAGICLYSSLMCKYMVKHGRLVDARVISCEENVSRDSETREVRVSYNVTVDFAGLHGDTVVKNLYSSDKAFSEGDLIPCRYLDSKGKLWPYADEQAKKGLGKGIWFVFGFFALVILLVLGMVVFREESSVLEKWFGLGFLMLTGILFLSVGVYGLLRQIKMKRNEADMQVIQGVLVDYVIDVMRRDGETDSDFYFPVYEYERMGETYHFKGIVGGSKKKYGQIGKKVQLLLNPKTGEMDCKEDRAARTWIFVMSCAIGIGVIALMLWCFSAESEKDMETPGTNQNGQVVFDIQESVEDNSDVQTEEVPFLEMFYLYAEDTRKCSYVVRIFDDYSGQVLLFPTVAVSGKGIDQQIDFSLTGPDMVKLGEWLNAIDGEDLDFAPSRDGEEVQISLNLHDVKTDERYSGRGYQDSEIYGSAFELIQELVPQEVWEELRERETEYYQE